MYCSIIKKFYLLFKVAVITFKTFEYIFLHWQNSGYEKLNFILTRSSGLTELTCSRFCNLPASL